MKLLLALFAASFLGCAVEAENADYYGDVNFSPEERAHIEEGAAWLYAQVVEPAPKISWTYKGGYKNTIPGAIVKGRGITDQGTTLGLCSGGVIYLDPIGLPGENMKPEYLPGLTAHEMAHCAFGFVDGYRDSEKQTDGIMQVLYPMRWTSAEQEQCAVSSKCPKH